MGGDCNKKVKIIKIILVVNKCMFFIVIKLIINLADIIRNNSLGSLF